METYKKYLNEKTETNTSKFEFSHGKKPKGYGQWFLELEGTDNNGKWTTYEYHSTGKLADVRKRAIKAFKSEVGVKYIATVHVLP